MIYIRHTSCSYNLSHLKQIAYRKASRHSRRLLHVILLLRNYASDYLCLILLYPAKREARLTIFVGYFHQLARCTFPRTRYQTPSCSIGRPVRCPFRMRSCWVTRPTKWTQMLTSGLVVFCSRLVIDRYELTCTEDQHKIAECQAGKPPSQSRMSADSSSSYRTLALIVRYLSIALNQ